MPKTADIETALALAAKVKARIGNFQETKQNKGLAGPTPSSELAKMNYEKAKISEPYQKLLGELSKDAIVMVFGDPGAGKTTNLLRLCRGLPNQKCLYVSFEQFGTTSLQLALARAGGASPNLFFSDGKQLDGPYTAPFDVVVVDSINAAGWGIEELRVFLKANKGKLIFFVVQSTKEGNFRGGRDIEHEADTVLKVEKENIFTEKNRFGVSQTIKNPFAAKPLEGVKSALQAKEAEIAKKKKNG